MASSASCPSEPVNDELKMDDFITKLHALKKLYKLLQKSSTAPTRPDQPAPQFLDEKSSHLLKKLLDDATQQVLDSQAKIISCTPEMPKSEEKPKPNAVDTEKLQECDSLLPPEKSPEPAIVVALAEPKILQSPFPVSEPVRAPSPPVKHVVPGNSTGNNLKGKIMNRPSASGKTIKTSQPLKSPPIRSSSRSYNRRQNSTKERDLLATIPAQKRQRVDRREALSRASSRSRKPDSSCELTHRNRKSATASTRSNKVEPNRVKLLQRTSSSKNCEPKRTSLARDQTTTALIQRNDRTAEIKAQDTENNHIRLAGLSRSKARKYLSSSSEPSLSNSGSSSSSWSIPLTPGKPSTIHVRRRGASPLPAMVRIVRKNDQAAESKRGVLKDFNPARSNRGSSRSAPKFVQRKHKGKKTKRREPPLPLPEPSPPPPPPKHRLLLVPRRPAPLTKARLEPKEEVQGRFRRLTNKLAVIFHHHHHHHHHLHAGEDGDKAHTAASFIWKHLKAVLHLGKNGKIPAEKGRHHGHLHVMIEGLLHHLWALRWRRRRRGKKVASRRVSTKHRLWAWFRRRGGVAVGGRRRLRMRLGPSGSHRRMAAGKG